MISRIRAAISERWLLLTIELSVRYDCLSVDCLGNVRPRVVVQSGDCLSTDSTVSLPDGSHVSLPTASSTYSTARRSTALYTDRTSRVTNSMAGSPTAWVRERVSSELGFRDMMKRLDSAV